MEEATNNFIEAENQTPTPRGEVTQKMTVKWFRARVTNSELAHLETQFANQMDQTPFPPPLWSQLGKLTFAEKAEYFRLVAHTVAKQGLGKDYQNWVSKKQLGMNVRTGLFFALPIFLFTAGAFFTHTGILAVVGFIVAAVAGIMSCQLPGNKALSKLVEAINDKTLDSEGVSTQTQANNTTIQWEQNASINNMDEPEVDSAPEAFVKDSSVTYQV